MKDVIIRILVFLGCGAILVGLFKYNPTIAFGRLLAHQITVKEFFKVLGKSVLFTLVIFAGLMLLYAFDTWSA